MRLSHIAAAALATALLWPVASARAESICDADDPPDWCNDEPGAQHDPDGELERVARAPGGVRVVGWAQDPDSAGPIGVRLKVGAQNAGQLVANGPAAGGHGFSGVVPAPAGNHLVCATALNVGAGSNAQFGCQPVTIGSDPVGALEVAERTAGGVRLRGWALDPDTAAPIDVHVYDGGPYGGGQFAGARPADRPVAVDPSYDGYGSQHGFDAEIAVAADSPRVCVHAINVAAGGTNTLLGCLGLPPAPPTGLAVSPAEERAVWIDWQDGSAHETGYRIELQRPDGGWDTAREVAALPGGSHRVSLPVPAPGRHCVRVRALNASGASSPAEACGDTRPASHQVSVLELNLVGIDNDWDAPEGGVTIVPWRERYDRVAKWMQESRHLPDVITLQEATGSKWDFWTGRYLVAPYEALFHLIDRINARTGANYRIAYLRTTATEGWNTLQQGRGLIYNADRLRNATPPGGDTATPNDAPEMDALHARTSYPCRTPPAEYATWCSRIDGRGVFWTATDRNEFGDWHPTGPIFSRFELLTDPGSYIHVYNVHAPLRDQQHSYYESTIRTVRTAETRWGSHRLYPPLISGDFNATLQNDDLEFVPGMPFEQFEIAGWPVPGSGYADVVGVLKGKLAAFPARDAGVATETIMPVDIEPNPYCGTPSTLWSDHCGVYVEIRPTGPLAPVDREVSPPAHEEPPLEPGDVDPRVCAKKPWTPGCG